VRPSCSHGHLLRQEGWLCDVPPGAQRGRALLQTSASGSPAERAARELTLNRSKVTTDVFDPATVTGQTRPPSHRYHTLATRESNDSVSTVDRPRHATRPRPKSENMETRLTTMNGRPPGAHCTAPSANRTKALRPTLRLQAINAPPPRIRQSSLDSWDSSIRS